MYLLVRICSNDYQQSSNQYVEVKVFINVELLLMHRPSIVDETPGRENEKKQRKIKHEKDSEKDM